VKVCKLVALAIMAILLSEENTLSQVSYLRKPRVGNYWESDSLFIGADIIAMNGDSNVIVRWKKVTWPAAIGELSFMIPGHTDSSMFLFHNRRDLFPHDPQEINLGTFPVGTKLFLKYIINDNDSLWNGYKGKRLFSGQNRAQIDPYKSDIKGQWCAAGQKNSNTVEAGFDFTGDKIYQSIVFEIINAQIQK